MRDDGGGRRWCWKGQRAVRRIQKTFGVESGQDWVMGCGGWDGERGNRVSAFLTQQPGRSVEFERPMTRPAGVPSGQLNIHDRSGAHVRGRAADGLGAVSVWASLIPQKWRDPPRKMGRSGKVSA